MAGAARPARQSRASPPAPRSPSRWPAATSSSRRWSARSTARPIRESDPFVEIGSQVKIGDTLCIIEAMKLMNEIESEFAGTVTEILVENGQPIEYGQPLFVIE